MSSRTSTRSNGRPAPAPARAAGSSPPTRWRRCASASASRRSAAPACRRSTRTRSASRAPPARSRWTCCGAASVPARSSRKHALENAIAAVAATGGSTNAVLHLLAIANEAGVPLDIDDFNRVNARVPLLADLKPGGRFVATDLHRAGGIPLVAKRLLDGGHLHADAITISGRTIGEHAREADRDAGSDRGAAAVEPDQADRRPGHPEGQPRAGRRGGEGRRLRHQGRTPARRGSSTARKPRSRRCAPGRSTPATSSSSATKVRAAAPGCARCSASPPRSWAPASAIRWRSSPTADSPARPAD